VSYIENPKTKGSGIISCIPQKGICPNKCEDCFFQSGRSYLEPLEKNLPNMPTVEQVGWRVVRVNDGNDSNFQWDLVVKETNKFPLKFYNTAFPSLESFLHAPVVLTINPGSMTDKVFYRVKPTPQNLMFVRFRTNTWNLDLLDDAVDFYSEMEVPIVLTFMAYFTQSIPGLHKQHYTFRKRTLNSYWAITTLTWETIMRKFKYNKWVHSCGKIEGEKGTTACRHCGNCLREFFATMERMSNGNNK